MGATEIGPLVSVLIPTFSRPGELAGALDSVLAQSCGDFEVVVGDDGELGAEVVASFRDPRVRYQRNRSRLGIARNWEALVHSARGAYVSFLMDDDRWDPNFLADCLAPFAQDPALAVVFSNHRFDRGGSRDNRPALLSPGRHDDFARAVLEVSPVAISAAVIRRAAWGCVGLLPDSGAADMVIFARIALAGHPFFYVDRVLMTYKAHGANYSGTDVSRETGVTAWQAIECPPGEVREARDRRLAEAFLSRATLRIQKGDLELARGDVDEARRLGAGGLRWLLVKGAASGPLAGDIAARVARVRRRLASRARR